MKDLIIDSIELSDEHVEIKDLINSSNYSISVSIFENILFNDKKYNKLIKYLRSDKIYELRIFQNFNVLFKASKIFFGEACLLYLKKYRYEDSRRYKEISNVLKSLNYENYINSKEYYKILMDDKEYKILINHYFEFLKSDNFYELVKNNHYHGIPITYFIYSLVSYFDNNKLFCKYKFPLEIKNRFLELKNNKLIDCQSINKVLKTKDKYQNIIRVSHDVYDIIRKRYDDDIFKNIIKVYIELCKMFSYDELFYINESGYDAKKHESIKYIPYINNKNNKVVCYEFPEIFGSFLNMYGIKYEILGGDNFYGLKHNYLVFRYGKYLIRVEPIKTVYDSDFARSQVNLSLEGFTCINDNLDTKEEFNKIINECYQVKDISIDKDILPANKIDNDKNNNVDINNYLMKIDLILKKINDLKLGEMEKANYFKILMKHIFTDEELKDNIFYTVVGSYLNLVYIIIINPDIIKRDDNVYLIYQDNNLSFIELDELRSLFEEKRLHKLGKMEIPGIDIENKRSK